MIIETGKRHHIRVTERLRNKSSTKKRNHYKQAKTLQQALELVASSIPGMTTRKSAMRGAGINTHIHNILTERKACKFIGRLNPMHGST